MDNGTPDYTSANGVGHGVLVVPAHGGGKLWRGGNHGGGRPTNEFKLALANLASSDETLDLLEEILSDDHHEHFMSALKHCTDKGYPELVRAAQASAVEIHQVDARTFVWKFGDREIPFK